MLNFLTPNQIKTYFESMTQARDGSKKDPMKNIIIKKEGEVYHTATRIH